MRGAPARTMSRGGSEPARAGATAPRRPTGFPPRLRARHHTPLTVGTALLLALAFAALAPAAPASAPASPPRPNAVHGAWEVIRIRGSEFVDLAEVAKRFGYQTQWEVPARKLTLTRNATTRLVFQADDRDFHLDGTRIFLSERVTALRGTLWLSKFDLLKTLGPLLAPATQAAILPQPPRLIVLDAGHGGTDPGKSNARHKVAEKDMTLDVVLRLKPLLEARGYRVLLTRQDDSRFANNVLIDLQRRADFANKAVADLFLSVHFNAVEPKDAARVTGSETYVLTPQSMLSTSDEKKDDLTDTAFPGNRNDIANVLLGFHLHRQILGDLKTSDRGFKRARFAVLRFVESPAALIEAAYLSNDDEAARVGTPEFRQQIAEAIARGVDAYAKTLAELHAARKAAEEKAKSEKAK